MLQDFWADKTSTGQMEIYSLSFTLDIMKILTDEAKKIASKLTD